MPYKILSPHYGGTPTVEKAPKLKPEDYKSSNVQLKLTPTSWPRDSSMPSAPHFVMIGKDVYAVNVTSNNKFFTSLEDYLKNGSFFQHDNYEIEGMRRNGSDNYPNRPSNQPMPKMPDAAYMESLYFPQMDFLHPSDTPVRLRTHEKIVEAVHMNNIGKYASKIHDLQSKIRKMIFDETGHFNKENLEVIEYLLGKGLKPSRTDEVVTATGIEAGDFYAAYYHSKGFLVANPNLNLIARKIMSRYGLNNEEASEAMERYFILYHEIINHGFFGIKGDRKGERQQGELSYEVFSMLADRYKGSEKEKIYKALSEDARDYAEYFSLWNYAKREAGKDPYKEKPNSLSMIVEYARKEGIELGKEGEDLRDYVESRIENIYGQLLKQKPTHNSRISEIERDNLEGRIDELITNDVKEKISKESYESKENSAEQSE